MLALIRQWLKATIVEPSGVRVNPHGKGTRQGGVISPLLSNIYLHWFETSAARAARAYFHCGYTYAAYNRVNWYAKERMYIRSRRRSQRGYKLKYASTFYGEITALTSIRQPCAEMARAAVETLFRRMTDPARPVCTTLLDAPLVVRDSTKT